MAEQMKLSEAIRAGAKLRPMGEEDYFVEVAKEGICSCALGAAYEALMGRINEDHDDVSAALEYVYPWLFRDGWLVGPNGLRYSIGNVVAWTNDSGRFTREEIADWLETCGL